MPLWQIALIVFALAWALQALGTFLQMRHYREVMGEISRRWSEGYVGAGNARARLGKGVILVLVVGSDMVVRRVMIMQGRSVFAKFKPFTEFDGQPLARVKGGQVLGDPGQAKAFAVAIAQIERAAQSRAAA